MAHFHRAVMRNRARQIARQNGIGVSAVWDSVREMHWVARGCRAVVWTAKNRRAPKAGRKSGVRHAAPRMRRESVLDRFNRLMREVAETANTMALVRSQARGR